MAKPVQLHPRQLNLDLLSGSHIRREGTLPNQRLGVTSGSAPVGQVLIADGKGGAYWGSGAGGITVVGEGPGIDVVSGSYVGLGGDSILVYSDNGTPIAEFPLTSEGLDQALASSGCGIQLPMFCSIDGDHEIPAGKSIVGLSRFGSKLVGKIVCQEGASLENLTIERASSGSIVLIGVEAVGATRLSNCHIDIRQSDTGDAYGLYANTGAVEAWMCSISASSVGGEGYAGGIGAEDIYIFGGKAYGSTNVFDV